MSAETDAKIKQYTDAKDAAYAAYQEELGYNTVGHTYATNGQWIKPYNNQQTTQPDFSQWLANSDASLAVKKSNWQNATSTLEAYLKSLDQATYNNAIASNPNIIVDIAKAKADAAASTEKSMFAQKTTIYLIVGAIVLVIVAVGIFIYRKKFSN